MKNLRHLIVVVFILLSQLSQSQLYVKGMNFRPTGELGSVMKPRFALEFGFTNLLDDPENWRVNIGATFIRLQPRMEEFPIYGVLSDGSGTHILPGGQTFTRYSIFQLYAGADYVFMQDKPFRPFAGFDVLFGGASIEYNSYVHTLQETGYSGGGVLGGGRLRFGLEYEINDRFEVFVSANRQYFLLTEPPALLSANDYGIGIRFQLGQ